MRLTIVLAMTASVMLIAGAAHVRRRLAYGRCVHDR